MMNPMLTVCILWHLRPICYAFKFQIKGLCVTLAGLNIISADIKCVMVVSRGFLVMIRLQHEQLLVPYQFGKGNLIWMAWSSLLCQAFRLQRFVKLHLSTSRQGETGDRFLILKWVDKVKYSVKLFV